MPYEPAFKDHIQNLFARKVAAFGHLVSLECELTTRCLNNCSYCGADIREQQGEVDFDILAGYLEAYAAHARQTQSAFCATLVGGDPVLYSRFDELLSFLATRGIPYVVKGNASTLSRKRAERLQATGCKGLKLTCYGEAPVHDAHRGFDTFRLLVERSQLARSLGIPVAWHLSVGRDNMDSILRLLPFLRTMDLEAITEGRIGKLGRLARDDAFVDPTPGEWRAFLLEVLQFHALHWRHGFRLAYRDKLWVPLLVEEGLLDLEPFRNGEIRLGCDLFTHLATVDFRGYLKACGLIESARKQVIFQPQPGARQIFLAGDWARLDPDSPCGRCTYRDFCRGCRAITLAATGKVDAQDPHCWVGRPDAPGDGRDPLPPRPHRDIHPEAGPAGARSGH